MQSNIRYKQIKKTTVIGAIVNALLSLIKVVGGVLFHSHALIADGIHSMADLLTDSMVIIAAKYGSEDADSNHPYGHQRIETAATLILSLFLIIVGVAMGLDAIDALMHPDFHMPEIAAVGVALISILANEGLFQYTKYIGHYVGSDLLLANAWHHRSDAASSTVVVIGLIGTLMGFHALDVIAACIVSLLIVKMGWDYGWNSIKELIDTAVEPELLQEIEKSVQEIPGVKKTHQLRTRKMASDIYIDAHILVDPDISVSEGHFIAQKVHQNLINKIAKAKDVTIHVDPEDDEITQPSIHLPGRETIESVIIQPIQQRYSILKNYNLHYLDGQLFIDLIFNTADIPKNFQATFEKLCEGIVEIKNVSYFIEISK